MGTHILWSPEGGICSICHKYHSNVRRFTSDGIHRIFCYPCWKIVESGINLLRCEWTDNVYYDFEVDNETIILN